MHCTGNEMPLTELKDLWAQFSTVCTDEDDCIEESFLHFSAGTDRTEIWEWFESKNKSFSVGTMINGGN